MSKKTNDTTNYPKDSHKEFCARCYKLNRCCPKTGRKKLDKRCNL